MLKYGILNWLPATFRPSGAQPCQLQSHKVFEIPGDPPGWIWWDEIAWIPHCKWWLSLCVVGWNSWCLELGFNDLKIFEFHCTSSALVCLCKSKTFDGRSQLERCVTVFHFILSHTNFMIPNQLLRCCCNPMMKLMKPDLHGNHLQAFFWISSEPSWSSHPSARRCPRRWPPWQAPLPLHCCGDVPSSRQRNPGRNRCRFQVARKVARGVTATNAAIRPFRL